MTNPTTAIEAGTPFATLINVFTVAPERQQELIAALDQATRDLFVAIPGFRSANLHASLDGARVVNYAQWASVDHFTTMLQRDDVREHMAHIMTIADKAEPRIFRVDAVHHPAVV